MGTKVTIAPVTRIEGHARITVHLNEEGGVDHTRFHVDQYRGFEKFCEGRPFFEMIGITPRICGICPVSHHLAAAKACDAVAGVTPPRPAALLRELMHMGQVIQSHALHFFHLASPDLLLGFDADPRIRNVIGLAGKDAELARKAVGLRKYGQEIIATLGEKKVHPHFAVPGGVNKALTAKEREEILGGLEEMTAIAREGLEIVENWAEANRELVDGFADLSTGYMGLVKGGNLELYDGTVRFCDAEGSVVSEFPPSAYLDYIAEHVEDWSYLKFPYYRDFGWPEGTYRVGPLGRLNAADDIGTPMASEKLKVFKAIGAGAPVSQTLYYHYARVIEILYGLERVRQLLDDPDILSREIRTVWRGLTGEGVGCLEAPRGTLFHHYWTDGKGTLLRANLIVATGHNNDAMNRSVDAVAKAFIKDGEPTEGMLNRVEAAIRAHDPCLSCSTHAMGRMPLHIEIRDAAGKPVRTLERSPR
ncbi:MAG: Ni/Fe hydrogenase subunit alpha [Synergistales bacterium]|nr:Ni/Fe hydrogenase subunit alpha [Synergistales bacterium]